MPPEPTVEQRIELLVDNPVGTFAGFDAAISRLETMSAKLTAFETQWKRVAGELRAGNLNGPKETAKSAAQRVKEAKSGRTELGLPDAGSSVSTRRQIHDLRAESARVLSELRVGKPNPDAPRAAAAAAQLQKDIQQAHAANAGAVSRKKYKSDLQKIRLGRTTDLAVPGLSKLRGADSKTIADALNAFGIPEPRAFKPVARQRIAEMESALKREMAAASSRIDLYPDAALASERHLGGNLVRQKFRLDKEGTKFRTVQYKSDSEGARIVSTEDTDLMRDRRSGTLKARGGSRTPSEHMERAHRADALRRDRQLKDSERKQDLADQMGEGRSGVQRSEQKRQLRQGQFAEAQKRVAEQAQAGKDKADALAFKTDPALRRFRRTDQEQLGRNRDADEFRAKRERSLSLYGTRRFNVAESGRVAPGFQMGNMGQQSKDLERYIEGARKAHNRFEKDVERFNKTNSHVGKNMVQNVAHVTAWAASVGVLYGSLNLVNYSLSQYIELQYQTARLQQVLRSGWEDSGTAARRLSEDVLFLAANTGRSSKEAMDAAISWARVLGSRREVATATGGSLLLANVGEISAAKSTEHLSSLMAVYKFRVADIAGVIGMANDMSNKWRITNEQMFNGLTRTASVAKQAGIPLAELMGIIGAGVGETGQTGANMGNAVKSMIGSLTSPDTQSFLREGFDLETTDGMKGLKPMPQLLSEIFVAYQKMTQAEKQSMVFGAVGKNQASRVAAMLDSYVQSQVLAISAQLNLNSAEKENEKIRTTMKSQLAGLSAEWDKFAVAVGNKGPGQAITDTAKALRALLAIFDGPKMSAISAGMMALGIGIGAKLLITKYQVSKAGPKGGMIANTAHAFGELPGQMAMLGNQALIRGSTTGSTLRSAGRGVKGVAGAAASPLESFKRTFKGTFASLQDTPAGMQWERTATGFRGIQVAAKTAEEGMMGMGRGAKFLRLGLLAVADVVVPLLVLWGAFKLIEAGAEAFGFTSSNAAESVDKMEKSALAARSAIEATNLQLRLLDTMQKALVNTTDPDARAALVKKLPEALMPDEGLDDERKIALNKTKIEAMGKELEAMVRIGDLEKSNARFLEFSSHQSAAAINRRRKERQKESNQSAAQISAWEREQRRLKKSMFGGGKVQIDEIQGKIDAKRGEGIQKMLADMGEQEESREFFAANSDVHQAYLARVKGTVESIRDLWASMPGDTHLDKLNKEIAANQMLLSLAQQQKAAAIARMKSLGYKEDAAQGIPSYQKEYDALSAEKVKIRELFSKESGVYDPGRPEIDGLGSALKELIFGPIDQAIKEASQGADAFNPVSEDTIGKLSRNEGGLPLPERVQSLAKDAKRKLDGLGASQEAMSQKEDEKTRLNKNVDAQHADEQRRDAAKRESELKARQHELESQRENRKRQDRIELATKLANSEGQGFAVGEDKTEELQSQVALLERSIALKKEFIAQNPKTGNAEKDRQTEVAIVQAMEHSRMLQDANVQLQMRALEIGREELNLIREKNREYQRGLLMAGPGEMLRKLAVSQMAKKGVNAGQFFALDPGARQDLLSQSGNDEGVQRIQRERARLEQAGYPVPRYAVSQSQPIIGPSSTGPGIATQTSGAQSGGSPITINAGASGGVTVDSAFRQPLQTTTDSASRAASAPTPTIAEKVAAARARYRQGLAVIWDARQASSNGERKRVMENRPVTGPYDKPHDREAFNAKRKAWAQRFGTEGDTEPTDDEIKRKFNISPQENGTNGRRGSTNVFDAQERGADDRQGLGEQLSARLPENFTFFNAASEAAATALGRAGGAATAMAEALEKVSKRLDAIRPAPSGQASTFQTPVVAQMA